MIFKKYRKMLKNDIERLKKKKIFFWAKKISKSSICQYASVKFNKRKIGNELPETLRQYFFTKKKFFLTIFCLQNRCDFHLFFICVCDFSKSSLSLAQSFRFEKCILLKPASMCVYKTLFSKIVSQWFIN